MVDPISSSLTPYWQVCHSFQNTKDLYKNVTFVDLLSDEYELFTLPAKKWHWRARTSALHLSQIIPLDHSYEVLFTTSVMNLAELIGMRPDLWKCKKIVYFHENQLVYPVQEIKERDCQYGFNEIMTWFVLNIF